MTQHHIWEGYSFEVATHSSRWADVPGIYIFAAPAGLLAPFGGGWSALYVGQATSFANRLPTHERWEEARTKKATHVHALHVPRQADRDAIEQHLIKVLQPDLNTQHKSFHPAIWGFADALSRTPNRSENPATSGIGLLDAFKEVPAPGAQLKGLLQAVGLDDVGSKPKPKLLVIRKGLLSTSR